jgi:hypothetical protein
VREWFKDWKGNPATVYFLGDMLKYAERAGHKDGETIRKDLEKMVDYAKKALKCEADKEIQGAFE